MTKRAIASGILLVVITITCLANAGSLTPNAPPGPTMHTLDEIYNKVSESIKISPNRFTVYADNSQALDRATGLSWIKTPDPTRRNWDDANTYCRNQIYAGGTGWRLPTTAELTFLIDPTQAGAVGASGAFAPALPIGHPFQLPVDAVFWTSNTSGNFPDAIIVTTGANVGGSVVKTDALNVWCVR